MLTASVCGPSMYSGLGKLGQGTSSISSNGTSKIADAGLKISATAFAFTLDVMVTANAAPTLAGWLWLLFLISKTPSERSITAALHGLS